jgi:hypothetical protein
MGEPEWRSDDRMAPEPLNKWQRSRVNGRVAAEGKSEHVAYLLWEFLPLFAHRVYLNQHGLTYAGASLCAVILFAAGYFLGGPVGALLLSIGAICLAVLCVISIFDRFMLGEWVEEANEAARADLSAEILGELAADPERLERRWSRLSARRLMMSKPVEPRAIDTPGPVFKDD